MLFMSHIAEDISDSPNFSGELLLNRHITAPLISCDIFNVLLVLYILTFF